MKVRKFLKPDFSSSLCCAFAASALFVSTNALSDEKVSAETTVQVSQILVTQFDFEGNSVFKNAELQSLLSNSVNQMLTLEDMQKAAKKVEDYYHLQGYGLAKVKVPQQVFVNGGAVKLVVLEGQLGNITIKGNERYAEDNVIESLANRDIAKGDPIKLASLEQSVVTLNRQSGIKAKASLKAGQEQGKTDLTIDITESPRVSGSFILNNYGTENTGKDRLYSQIQLANLSGVGDDLSFMGMSAVDGGDAWFAYSKYTRPLNMNGTSIAAYVSTGNVKVGEDLAVLNIKGDSLNTGIGISHDIIYSAREIITFGAWLESSDSKQTILGEDYIDDSIRKLRVGMSTETTGIGYRTLMSLDIHKGLGENLGAMENNSNLSSRSYSGADNNFAKYTFSITHIRKINSYLTVLPRIYGQYAFNSLVSGETMAIGGKSSVPGHLASAYSGDSGTVASIEARVNLFADNSNYQVIGSLSHGSISIKKPYVDQENVQRISGASLGFALTPIKNLHLRIDAAAPIGPETDGDSSIYAQAQVNF